ncbi:MAG TPA: c-type cytochrome [Anaerolineales bacterium]|nr:c-type cytochrome [Anaerolineales bacterium]
MRLFKQLVAVLGTLGLLLGVMMLFTYDVIKLEWPSFMEIQPVFKNMENPLPPPGRSIPVEGAVSIPGLGAPENPTAADESSVARGAELYNIHCAVCHGATGEGNGSVAPFLIKYKPANLTTDIVQSKSDGSFFLTISNGLDGKMPALNENLTVPERWDVVNFLRTLKASE